MLTRLVQETMQRVEAEAALAVRAGALLVGVALEQLRVEVERDRCRPRPQCPRPLARASPRCTDRRQLRLAERVQQPRRGRVRGDRAEQIGLLRQRPQIGNAIAAVDHRRREINQHPSRIVLRPPTKQMPKPPRQPAVKADPGGQLWHQRRAGTRNERRLIGGDLKRSEPAAMLHSQGASSSCEM